MKRIFNIEIYSDYGWEVDLKGFKGPYHDYKHIKESPDSIGICVKQNNQLIAMYDPYCPTNEAIKEVRQVNIFQEVCVFKHLEYIFQGTFTDALSYIQKQYMSNNVRSIED